MRHLSWLAVTAAFLAGGCQSPCGDGACSPGGALFNTPSTRYFGTEQLVYRDTPCDDECTSSGYLTLAKYWPALDGWATRMTARKCARKELLRRQWSSRAFLSRDYKRGYTQAYMDIANGESGDVPAVPPPRYWNTAYRSDRGRAAAEAWFEGYRAGAADASVRLRSLRQIATSTDWLASRQEETFAPDSATGPIPQQFQPLSSAQPISSVQTVGPVIPPAAPDAASEQPMPWRQQLFRAPAAMHSQGGINGSVQTPGRLPFRPSPNQSPTPNQRQQRQPARPAPFQTPVPFSTPASPHYQHHPGTTGPNPPQPLSRPTVPSTGRSMPVTPGYAAPTQPSASLLPPTANSTVPPASSGAGSDAPNRIPADRTTSGYSPPSGTSAGGGLPSQLSQQKLGPPPGMFNDPPVWRSQPGHSPMPQQ